MATATPDLRLTSNQIKSNLLGTQDHKTQTASYKIKNIKNFKTWEKRCNQDPKAEAYINMGPKEKFWLHNTVKQHNQHNNNITDMKAIDFGFKAIDGRRLDNAIR